MNSGHNINSKGRALLVTFSMLAILGGLLHAIPTVGANTVNYHLYGATQGWGFTSTVTSPGPTITAVPGGEVLVTLTGADNAPHNFFVDYNLNSVVDAGEPVSADFQGSASSVSFSFVATTTPGTYRYACEYHTSNQFGDFIVTAGNLVYYSLYGATQGWGYTSTVSSPGPDLTASPGGTVVLTLTGADNAPHNFFVDYNLNSVVDAGEPVSADFQGSTSSLSFSFAATTTTGTYRYACEFHTSNQFGTFTVTSGSLTYHTLYGSTQGWGFTPTVSSPGPTLSTTPGGTVVMALRGADNAPHNFLVDYSGNNVWDTGEPVSADFSGQSSILSFSFTATTTPGTYKYICEYHSSNQWGNLVVQAPRDIGITSLSMSRNFAYSGVSSNPITIEVFVVNQGTTSETFPVTARAGSNNIGTQTVSVMAGSGASVVFSWDAHLLPRGSYVITAEVPALSGEINLDDNTFDGGGFTLRLAGDVTNDCVVNVSDLASVGAAFGSSMGPPASPNWNPNADLNNDGVVNVSDLAAVGSKFGQVC